jgi:hypothetical protein
MPPTARGALGPMLALQDLHFQKKFKLIKEKCEIPNRC